MKNNFVKPPQKISLSRTLHVFTFSVIAVFATVFTYSCKKEIDQNFSGIPTADSTSGNVSALAVKNTYYVSPTGNDANPGNIDAPFATWEKLSSILTAGDLAYIRGGTYRVNKAANADVRVRLSNLNGTSADPIRIYAYPGESPVLNLDNILVTEWSNYGVYLQNSSYVHVKGLRVTGLAQHTSGNVVWGFTLAYSNNCTIEQVEVDHIGGQGFNSFHSSDILYKNCDAHHLDDRYSAYAWNGSNGFSASSGDNTSTRNTYDGCRAWWVSDDGWDFFACDGFFTIKNCWSFWNGYQPGTFTTAGDGAGYKLGPTTNKSTTLLRVLSNNLAVENRAFGFDQNDGNCIYNLYNNTSYKNQIGFFWSYHPSLQNISKNNISLSDATNYAGTSITGDHNSWNGGVSLANDDFMSISTSGIDGARSADGSLPQINLLRLASSSDLINAGVNIGLPFVGNAPDLGAFENGSTQTVTNQAPSANAGADKNITLPINTVLISGSGSDPDGSISTYIWTFRSGPNTPALAGASTTALTANNLIAGTYVFRLTVTDNSGATAFDEVSVVVGSTAVIPPVVGSSINVSQSVSDGGYGYYLAQNFGTPGDNGTYPSQSVLKIYENGVALNPAHSAHADIRSTGSGRFSHWGNELYFSASDNTNPKTNGRTYTYTIATTSPPTNQAPVANAGADKTITLPASSVSIAGNGSDADGTITSYAWTFRTGPGTPSLSGSTTTILVAGNLKAGTYVFRLTVADNGGLTAYDEVKVVVKKASVAKTINVSQSSSDGGYAYFVAQNFGTVGDDAANPAQSVLKIYENGVLLNPAHAGHADIRNNGQGRFSHWGNTLYFSATDNTNPKTNGRTYTYTIQ
jgi:hypothetical protein